MYGHMYNYNQYGGYSNMPFQPSAVPSYRQQLNPYLSRMDGWQRPQVYPYANTVPYSYYPPLPEMNPHFHPAGNGFQQDPVYLQQNGPPLQHVFQNPLNPSEQNGMNPQQKMRPNEVPYMNPYPKGSSLTKQPSGMKTMLNSFKGQDGSLDINKMVDTAGQMVNAVSQVTSVVKGFGGMFKG
jgi:YppG-like protein